MWNFLKYERNGIFSALSFGFIPGLDKLSNHKTHKQMKYSTVTGIDENGMAVSIGRNGHIKEETAEKIAIKERLHNVTLRHIERSYITQNYHSQKIMKINK